MKQRDIEAAYVVLAMATDPEATKKRLDALQKAKAEADEAKAKAEQAQHVQEQFGDRLEKDRQALVQFNEELIQRERRLNEAERQLQFTMDGELKGLQAQKEALADLAKELEKSRKQLIADSGNQSLELIGREKALEKRERDAQKVDETLTEREQILKQGMKELADTKARLRELAA